LSDFGSNGDFRDGSFYQIFINLYTLTSFFKHVTDNNIKCTHRFVYIG
jgi:hypothetical protein